MTRLPWTLQSRVGRRIVTLFVLSALVPILVLTVLGYFQVRNQLLDQARAQLGLSAKSVGMNLIDQLRVAAELIETSDTVRQAAIASRLVRRAPAHPQEQALEIVAGPDSAAPAIWLLSRSGAIRAELRHEHLFRGARDRAAVGMAETDLCVRDTRTGLALHCEFAEEPGPRVGASWDLFLAYDYGAPAWRIEVAMPRAAVLAPVLAFRRTLIATLVLVLGLVIALASSQVRRSLEPLEALRDGTRRLAVHDFSQPVTVASRDEFQELAESFNTMSGELNREFSENAQLITRLNELSWGALAALGRTVDASSPWTAGHSERVTSLSLRMAQRLGLGKEDQDTLHRGGLLHDIGKIGVAPEILDKPDKLTFDELARIREHPILGAKILAPLSAFADAIPIVLYHHERWDGTGYPSCLMGTRIPRLARLLSVADVYDALVSNRPYRAGWSHEAAMAEIRTQSGTQFDPQMVVVFEEVMAAEGDAARFTLAEKVSA